MTYWHRMMANNLEGSERHEFAKRIVFFHKMRELQKRALESSPRSEIIPPQKIDQWYEIRETAKGIASLLNPKQLIP